MFVGHEQLKRSKRTRIILICVIVVLIAALGGLGYLGFTVFQEGAGGGGSVIKPLPPIDEEVKDPDAPDEMHIQETSIPNLVSLFGLTIDEVGSKLGGDFQLKSTAPVDDPSNTHIKQLATFSYNVTVVGGNPAAHPSSLLPSQSVYVSLDEDGRVIDIYYTCDMRLLGYPDGSFGDLLANDSVVSGSLAAAGITPRDFVYAAPNPEECITYDNANSANRKVVKQSQIFSGRNQSDSIPTAWTLTVTYDFGSGVASVDEYREATRIISLKLA
jgi:hypothetical protein